NEALNENYGSQRTPKVFLVRDVLRACQTVPAALTYLKKTTPADYAIYTLVDETSPGCRVVETTPKLFSSFAANDPAEDRKPFQPLSECVRRTYRYVDPQLDNTLRFFCGVYMQGMM